MRHPGDLQPVAEEVALRARAIRECEDHEGVLIGRGDAEANERAYALGTTRWEQGGLECSLDDFKAAIKSAIEAATSSCAQCDKLRKG